MEKSSKNRVSSEKCLKIMHISEMPIWDMGQGKGRISTYLPLKAFVDRGHEVWFFTSSKKQKPGNIDGINVCKLKVGLRLLTKGYWANIKIVGLIIYHLYRPFSFFAFLSLATIQCIFFALRHKVDLIYSHGIFATIPAFVISKIMKVRYVLRSYGIGRDKMIFNCFMFKTKPDLCIIVNDGTNGRDIARKYGIPNDKICFWVNGIDKDWSNMEINNDFRERLCLNGEKIVLSLCRLEASKQVDILIRAIPDVIKGYKNVKFVIIGDGEERKKLEVLAENLKISDFIRFVGAVEHSAVLDYIVLCDIFASMNGLSSICNPVLEAMTCGKAVIALNTGNTGDLIKDHFNGLLVDTEKVHLLPDYIVSILKNDDLRMKLGENAQKYMMDHWPTWEERINSEVEIIETLCSGDSQKLHEVRYLANKMNPLENII